MLFAKRIGVHPGLVVGQLQFRDEVPYTHFHKYQVKIGKSSHKQPLRTGGKLSLQHKDKTELDPMSNLNEQLLQLLKIIAPKAARGLQRENRSRNGQ